MWPVCNRKHSPMKHENLCNDVHEGLGSCTPNKWLHILLAKIDKWSMKGQKAELALGAVNTHEMHMPWNDKHGAQFFTTQGVRHLHTTIKRN